jgi:MoxR-like ATPase
VTDVDAVVEELRAVGYLADESIATTVSLARVLQKPILAEGPAGTGKTELAKALARSTGRRLVRLQCYEGLDEAKVLYEWDYKKQLLRIQSDDASWAEVHEDLFGPQFLLARPLLEAIRSPEPVVLLVDEIDRVELETEALLLEVLSDYQVSIPELGTLHAEHIPMVVLTSNNMRDLSEALRRRCLYVHVGYPSIEREEQIVRSHVPGIDEGLAAQVVRVVELLRSMDLEKAPSISETVDWAKALVAWNVTHVDAPMLDRTISVVLKHQADIVRARQRLQQQG